MWDKKCKDCGRKTPSDESVNYVMVSDVMKQIQTENDPILTKMQDHDILCHECFQELNKRHAVEIYKFWNKKLTTEQIEEHVRPNPELFEIYELAKSKLHDSEQQMEVPAEQQMEVPAEQQMEVPAEQQMEVPAEQQMEVHAEKTQKSNSPTNDNPPVSMTADELRESMKTRFDEFKNGYDKNDIVQFKNENIAILKRVLGHPIQFIIAYSKLTEEGYRLMTINERNDDEVYGFVGKMTSFYYFQKMKWA